MTPQELAERVREMCAKVCEAIKVDGDPYAPQLIRAAREIRTLDISPLTADNAGVESVAECGTCRCLLLQSNIDKCSSGEACPHYRIRALAQETGNWAHCRHGSCRNERECRWPESCDYKAGLDKPVTTAPTAGGLPEEPPNIEFLAENIPVGESRTIRLEMPEPVVKRSDYNKLRTAAEALQAENERLQKSLDLAIDSEMDKLLAMPDERIQASLRMEGRDPDDVAKIGKLIGDLSIAKHDLAKAEQSAAQLREQLAAAMAWKGAALRVGEELSDSGPNGYYDMTPEQWRAWAITAIQAAERGEKET